MMHTGDLLLLLTLTGFALSNPIPETGEHKKSVVSFQSLNNEPEQYIEVHSDDYLSEIKGIAQLIESVNADAHVDFGEYGLKPDELLVSGVSVSQSPISLGGENLGPIAVAIDENPKFEPLKVDEKKQQPEISHLEISKDTSLSDVQILTSEDVHAVERPLKEQRFVTVTRTAIEAVEEEVSTIFVHEVHTMTKKFEPTPKPQPKSQNGPVPAPASRQMQHTPVHPGPISSPEYSAGPILLASLPGDTQSAELKQLEDENPNSEDQKPETMNLDSITTDSLRELFREILLDFRKEFSGPNREKEEPNMTPSVLISLTETAVPSLVTAEQSDNTPDKTFSIPSGTKSPLNLDNPLKDLDIDGLESFLKGIMHLDLIPKQSPEKLDQGSQSQVTTLENPVDLASFEKLVSGLHRVFSETDSHIDEERMIRALGLRDKAYALLKRYPSLLSLGRLRGIPKGAARDILDFVHSKDKQRGIQDLRNRTFVKGVGLNVTRTEEDTPDSRLDPKIWDTTSFDALEKQVNEYPVDHPTVYEEPDDFDETDIDSGPIRDQKKEEDGQVQEERIESKLQAKAKHKKPKKERHQQEQPSKSKGRGSIFKGQSDVFHLEGNDFEEHNNPESELFDNPKQSQSDIHETRMASSNDNPRKNSNKTKNTTKNSADIDSLITLNASSESSSSNLTGYSTSLSSTEKNAREPLDVSGNFFESDDDLVEMKLNKRNAAKSDNRDKYMTTPAKGLTKGNPSSDSKASRHEFLEKVKNNPSSLFDKHNEGHQEERDSTKGFFDITSGSSESLRSVSRSYAFLGTILTVFGVFFL
jgi:hypothetical protein